MASAKFVIEKGKGGFRFNLISTNGEPILHSERYNTKDSAKRGIKSVKKHAGKLANYVEAKSKNGKSYFNLRAANNRIIGTSEMYSSPAKCKAGIDAVKRVAGGATIEDKS
ncbi:MAG: YegP family protein [Anaerolineales bacterium]|nr:MAG: YegP family protein [Anaerolineales bacterium]